MQHIWFLYQFDVGNQQSICLASTHEAILVLVIINYNEGYLFTAVFSQLRIFTADCLLHTVQILLGIETVWELHTLTIAGDSKTVFSFNLIGGIACLISTYFQHVLVIEGAAFSPCRCQRALRLFEPLICQQCGLWVHPKYLAST